MQYGDSDGGSFSDIPSGLPDDFEMQPPLPPVRPLVFLDPTLTVDDDDDFDLPPSSSRVGPQDPLVTQKLLPADPTLGPGFSTYVDVLSPSKPVGGSCADVVASLGRSQKASVYFSAAVEADGDLRKLLADPSNYYQVFVPNIVASAGPIPRLALKEPKLLTNTLANHVAPHAVTAFSQLKQQSFELHSGPLPSVSYRTLLGLEIPGAPGTLDYPYQLKLHITATGRHMVSLVLHPEEKALSTVTVLESTEATNGVVHLTDAYLLA
jgi:hypothetical protein